ncbi:hypothetical protein [Kitasatospora purpeofusca]|uniref:hypothetical protein n=1 Tax=Kitasatospora purpeofusca TaxID=67352 RepID=UPI00386FC6B8|nr:hypothetical protein OIP63_00115 [Kitasatospora purpeofusca]
MSKEGAGAGPSPRVVQNAVRRYKKQFVSQMVSGAASALGAGTVGLLFWWLERLG